MLIVPLQPVPSQAVTVTLAQQLCKIAVYQKSTGLFLDLYKSDALVIGGVICENRNRIVRSAYLGFIGDLCFIDTQGNSDPTFDGIGSRYWLAYLEETDVAALEAAA